jgi:hypothetical protein
MRSYMLLWTLVSERTPFCGHSLLDVFLARFSTGPGAVPTAKADLFMWTSHIEVRAGMISTRPLFSGPSNRARPPGRPNVFWVPDRKNGINLIPSRYHWDQLDAKVIVLDINFPVRLYDTKYYTKYWQRLFFITVNWTECRRAQKSTLFSAWVELLRRFVMFVFKTSLFDLPRVWDDILKQIRDAKGDGAEFNWIVGLMMIMVAALVVRILAPGGMKMQISGL